MDGAFNINLALILIKQAIFYYKYPNSNFSNNFCCITHSQTQNSVTALIQKVIYIQINIL